MADLKGDGLGNGADMDGFGVVGLLAFWALDSSRISGDGSSC